VSTLLPTALKIARKLQTKVQLLQSSNSALEIVVGELTQVALGCQVGPGGMLLNKFIHLQCLTYASSSVGNPESSYTFITVCHCDSSLGNTM